MAREDLARGAVAVTPSDSTVFDPTFGVYVGGAGNVAADLKDEGKNVVFTAVPAGTFLPLQVTRIYATGTTATSIVALY